MTSTTIYKHADFETPQWGEFATAPEDQLGTRSLILSHNPIAYWRLGETSGTTAMDVSGDGHHGTYSPGVQLDRPGALDRDDDPAITLHGSTGWIDLPGSFSVAVDNPITVVFWNHVATAEVQKSIAFWLGESGSPNACRAHAPWDDLQLYWDFGTFDADGRVSADYSAYLDRWTHVALVSAGRLGNFKAIYLDGELVASSPTSNGPLQTLTGGTLSVDPAVSNRQHRGGLDEFAIFDRVLSAEQIQQLYRAGVNPWA